MDTGFRAVELSLAGSYIFPIHGINAETPEDTMRNMGLISFRRYGRNRKNYNKNNGETKS
ncbi:hypothetical protein OGZ02_07000 [Brachyspira hyodysenteriae]|nr:hypothetical protein [Brachyspira hyodysenteriae]MDA1468591.1 hypothetical protein [Brachyspira hyodysenteriae]